MNETAWPEADYTKRYIATIATDTIESVTFPLIQKAFYEREWGIIGVRKT